MDKTSILILSLLMNSIITYDLNNYIVHNELFLRPIAWDDSTFTIIYRDNRIVFKFSDFQVTLDQLLNSRMFFAGVEGQFLVLETDETVKLLDIVSGPAQIIELPPPPNKTYKYAPQKKKDRLWRFETASMSQSGQDITIIESIDMRGDPDPPGAKLEKSLDSTKMWRFSYIFEWKDILYATIMYNDFGGQLLFSVQPLADKGADNFEKLIKVFRFDEDKAVVFLERIELIPSETPILYGVDERNSLLKGDFEQILASLSLLAIKCTQESKTFSDFTAFLAKPQLDSTDYCDGEKIPVFNILSDLFGSCITLRNNKCPLSYHISYSPTKSVLVLIGPDRFQLCYSQTCRGETFFGSCEVMNFPGGEYLQPTIDTRRAFVVVPIRGNDMIVSHNFPINRAEFFTTCPDCVMFGYHQNFTWTEDGGCGPDNVTSIDVCFDVANATRTLIDGDRFEYTIRFPYVIRNKYREKAYVTIGGTDYDVTDNKTNAYKVITPNINSSELYINIIRSSGGPMVTSFRISGYLDARTPSDWSFLKFILLALSIVAAIVYSFLLFREHQKKKSPKSEKTEKPKQLEKVVKSEELVELKESKKPEQLGEVLKPEEFVEPREPKKSVEPTSPPGVGSQTDLPGMPHEPTLELKDTKSGFKSKSQSTTFVDNIP